MRVINFFALLLAAQLVQADSVQDGVAAFQQGHYSTAFAKLKGTSDPVGRLFFALTQAALNDCASGHSELTAATSNRDGRLAKLAGIALAKCYESESQFGQATVVLDQLSRRIPNDADLLYAAAKLHMRAFNDATLKMFQRTPASYRVHQLSAEIFEVESKYTEAIAEYKKALELNPSAPDLHYRLGRALLLQAHSNEALESARAEFASELKINPEDAACEYQIGQIALAESKSDDARRHFERASVLSPNFAEALVALGKLDLKAKRYTDAVTSLERAIQLQPSNEAAHYALMNAYRNSGQLDKAKQEKATLDKLQKPADGEFNDFLKRLGEKPQP